MLTVVTGPPCSGKSTYVRDRAQHGDVVIDLDHIAAALTPTDDVHDYPAHIRAIARRVRRTAIEAAFLWHQQGGVVWVVDTAPSQQARAWYRRNRATLVPLAVTQGEIEARLAERSEVAQQHVWTLLNGANAQVRGP
jgi:predicted kinase